MDTINTNSAPPHKQATWRTNWKRALGKVTAQL